MDATFPYRHKLSSNNADIQEYNLVIRHVLRGYVLVFGGIEGEMVYPLKNEK
jgi:hypothetical protein